MHLREMKPFKSYAGLLTVYQFATDAEIILPRIGRPFVSDRLARHLISEYGGCSVPPFVQTDRCFCTVFEPLGKARQHVTWNMAMVLPSASFQTWMASGVGCNSTEQPFSLE